MKSCVIWFNFSYQKSSRYARMGYEDEFSKFLLALISDVDRRIRRGEQRLVLNNQPNPVRIMHNTITCFAVDVLLFF